MSDSNSNYGAIRKQADLDFKSAFDQLVEDPTSSYATLKTHIIPDAIEEASFYRKREARVGVPKEFEDYPGLLISYLQKEPSMEGLRFCYHLNDCDGGYLSITFNQDPFDLFKRENM